MKKDTAITPIKKKEGKKKYAHTRLNGKIEKQDLGMEGGEETLRARETKASVLPGGLHFVAFMFAQNLQFLYICIIKNSL